MLEQTRVGSSMPRPLEHAGQTLQKADHLIEFLESFTFNQLHRNNAEIVDVLLDFVGFLPKRCIRCEGFKVFLYCSS